MSVLAVCAHAGYLAGPAVSTAYVSRPAYAAYAAPAYAAPAYAATYAAPALVKAAAPAVDYYVRIERLFQICYAFFIFFESFFYTDIFLHATRF